MDVDSETLELLERRLAENIEKRVRTRLIWPVMVVVAVVGFFGYDVVSGMRDAAILKAQESVKDAVRDATAAVDEAVNDAEQAVDEVDSQVALSRSMISVIEEWMDDRRRRLTQTEDEIARRMVEIDMTTKNMNATLQAVQAEIDRTDSRIEAQQSRAEALYAGAGNLADLAGQLATLAEQVRQLDERMAVWPPEEAMALPAEGGDPDERPAPPPPEAQRQQTYESIITTSREIGEQKSDGSAMSGQTVFIQYAGGEKAAIERVMLGLLDRGYNVPGAERVKTADGLAEVRYFFDDDADAAHLLEKAVNQLLAEAGYAEGVVATDLTGFRGTKPRPGVLELWLDPKRG